MRVFTTCFTVLFLLFSVAAQDHAEATKDIRTLDEAMRYADQFPEVNIIFLNDKTSGAEYASRKDTLQSGDLFKMDYYQVRIIKPGKKKLYRFNLMSLTDEETPNAYDLSEKALSELKSGKSFANVYEAYGKKEIQFEGSAGDVGWVDPDYFIPSFKESLVNARKGDKYVWHDTSLGWHNLVEVTNKPRKFKGHFALFFPFNGSTQMLSNFDHDAIISELTTEAELTAYARSHDYEVSLQLVNESLTPDLFAAIANVKSKAMMNTPVVYDFDGIRYRWVKDTVVELFSIQYIYLNGAEISKAEKDSIIHDVYNGFHSGVSFDALVAKYWPDNNGLSKLTNIEGGLLADDLVVKVRETDVGELFVARVGQSYFLGVPLNAPIQANAFLMLGYPIIE